MRKAIKIKSLLVAFCALCMTTAVGFGLMNAVADEPQGKTITIDTVDPILLKRGVNGTGNDDRALEIEETAFTEIADDVIAYTGRYYYMNSRSREGAVEYAVSISGTGHVITAKYDALTANDADGTHTGNKIPVPGYLLSVPADKVAEYNFTVGDEFTLSNDIVIPTVAETVDNITKGVRVEIQNTSMATNDAPGSVYYGNEFGRTTKQNTWNREVGFSLIQENGENLGKFEVVSYRQANTTTVLKPNNNSVEWNGDFVIPNPGFALISNAVVSDDAYTNAIYSMLNFSTTFTLGDVVEISGREFFDFEYSVTATYDFIDPTDEENPAGAQYPENRGSDQMMIYYKSVEDGKDILQTNEYGFEAAVDKNGKIIQTAVNVGTIPEGGFVLSAHGILRGWARTYYKKGASVTVDTMSKTYTITSDLSTLRDETNNDIALYEKEKNAYQNGMYDLDTTMLNDRFADLKTAGEEMVAVISNLIDNKGDFSAKDELDQLVLLREKRSVFEEAKINFSIGTIESRVVEGRGVWHVPNINGKETSLAGIRDVLKVFNDLNLNIIFIEEYYAGYSHAVVEGVPQNPDSKIYDYSGTGEGEDYGNDYIKAFLTEAKKLGFEVHFSLTAGYLGRNDKWLDEPDRLWMMHPEWRNVSSEGYLTHIDGHQTIYADMANEEYRAMLIGHVAEMFEKYPEFDGVNVDFVRYPDRSSGRDFGYTMASMQKFLAKYQYTFRGSDIEDVEVLRKTFHAFVSSNSTIKAQWDEFRRTQVTETLTLIRNTMKAGKDSALLSISVGPSPESARNSLLQDWLNWIKAGLIDFCTPMAYYTDASTVEMIATKEVEYMNNLAYNYIGVGPYLQLEPNEWVKQVEATQNAKAMGYSFFSSQQILEEVESGELGNAVALLKNSAMANEAILPHANAEAVIHAYFASILNKATNIYLTNEAMTAQQYQALESKLNAIEQMSVGTPKELYAVYQEIEKIYNEPGQYVSRQAKDRLKADLELLLENINLKINRMLVGEGVWNPLVSMARPVLSDSQPNKIVWPKEDTTVQPVKDSGCNSTVSVALGILPLGLLGFVLARKKGDE